MDRLTPATQEKEGNMDCENDLENALADLKSIFERAKKGERGRVITYDLRHVRNRLEDIESALEEPIPDNGKEIR